MGEATADTLVGAQKAKTRRRWPARKHVNRLGAKYRWIPAFEEDWAAWRVAADLYRMTPAEFLVLIGRNWLKYRGPLELIPINGEKAQVSLDKADK